MSKELSGPITDTGVGTRDFFEGFPLSQDPDYVYKMWDFMEVALDLTNDWTAIKDGGASAAAIVADKANGYIILGSQATTDDSGGSLQGNENVLPADGRTIWFEAKLQLSDADQMDFYMGLSENFVTNPEAVLTASNRIGFQINDGNASILCKTEKADVETSKDSEIDAVDATDIVLGFRVLGLTQVEFYVNRILKATHTSNIPIVELTPAMMELSGNATGTKSMSVDYVMVVASR